MGSENGFDRAYSTSSVNQYDTTGKGFMALLVVMASVTLVVSIVALVFGLIGYGSSQDALRLSETAEREGRLAQYELTLIRPALKALGVDTEDPETHEE